jgi:site-specific DNA recombinase
MSEYIYNPPPTLPPGSLVIAYLRDSGGRNQEDSIGQQERVLIDHCQKHGLILGKIYFETASGRKTKQRGEFLQMIDSVMSTPKDLRPAGLILWSYSRFTRADVAEFNHYFYGLIMQGLIIHALIDEIPEGLAGQIMLSVKAYSNADYSIQLGKNIKRAIADNVRKGFNNGGQAPRGYIVVRELHDNTRGGSARVGIKWIPDPELSPLVRLAWELRAQGKSYSILSKATGGKLYTIPGSWATHFMNKSYLGIGKANDLEIPDHHEALITHELWDAVRKVQEAAPRLGARGKLLHPRRMSHPSLLSGLAFCIHCNAAMILHTSKDYRCYICGTHDRKQSFSECKAARRVNARKADALILDIVLNRILSPEFINDLLGDIQSEMADTGKIDREIGEVNNILILNARAITRLMKLAEGAGELGEITTRLKELKREEAEHTAKIKRLKAQLAVEMPQLTPEALALVFSAWRDQISNAYQSGDILSAKNLLTQFVKRIDLSHDTAIIHYAFPVSDPAEKMNAFSAH